MLYGDTYMTAQRFHLVSLERLPQGWQRGKPHVVSAYFDMLMSRWLDDELIASNRQTVAGDDGSPRSTPQEVARLKVAFRGRMVMLFGEATPTSGRYRAYLDGRLVEHKSPDGKETLTEYDAGQLARRLGGNTHHAQVHRRRPGPPDRTHPGNRTALRPRRRAGIATGEHLRGRRASLRFAVPMRYV